MLVEIALIVCPSYEIRGLVISGAIVVVELLADGRVIDAQDAVGSFLLAAQCRLHQESIDLAHLYGCGWNGGKRFVYIHDVVASSLQFVFLNPAICDVIGIFAVEHVCQRKVAQEFVLADMVGDVRVRLFDTAGSPLNHIADKFQVVEGYFPVWEIYIASAVQADSLRFADLVVFHNLLLF